ncbi:MAG: pyridoxine 5'-phosphate synthase [Planctomycetota bacterium]|nr:pyridoxine 5'-phosphate synthase [Planctomycetota bacterium]MDA1139501.1 pyridoxine 5'-phosphate synthase [Planctomycetota bacterium]
MSVKLGVNVDHVATVRQARMCNEPDPVIAAALSEFAGADGITIHLREDRRHIQDRDLRILRETVTTRLNLEMACADEIIEIALATKPEQVTLVPEKRREVTTEGGLNVIGEFDAIKTAASRFKAAGIRVSLFVDPDAEQLQASADTGAEYVELHTGVYANQRGDAALEIALRELHAGAEKAHLLGLGVNAGHGLNYFNVQAVCRLPHMYELNIGHSIVSRAVYVGITQAVKEMKQLMNEA